MSASMTVHFTMSAIVRPLAARTALMFSIACRASSRMPPGASCSVPGWPDRYSVSPWRTASANGRPAGRILAELRICMRASLALQRMLRSARMRRVDPPHILRRLRRLDVQVDRHRLAVAAHQHAFERLGRAGVDLLVRHEGRHVDEVAGTGLGGELQVLAPAHARAALDDVDHALQRPVVMRAGL